MIYFRYFAGILLGLFAATATFAQFQFNGTAYERADGCVGFEPFNDFKGGSFWHLERVDLSEDFDRSFRVFLGCDEAAQDDGLAFLFQPIGASAGSYYRRLGYQGLGPSFAVELDIRFDPEDADPGAHHLSVIANGLTNHQGEGNLVSPVRANPENDNILDCRFHELRIVWLARNQTLEVYFDCQQRISYSFDIVNRLFMGDPRVYWGFTSATHSDSSAVQICFPEESLLNELEDVELCRGSELQLEAPRPGIAYRWSPPETLNNPQLANPIARPEQTTTYRVTITQECGQELTDEMTVTVLEDQAVNLGPPDTTFCAGATLLLEAAGAAGSAYRWSTGAEGPTLRVTEAGTYGVTVTRAECIATDFIAVSRLDPPVLSLPAKAVICDGESLTLNAGGPGDRVRWNDGATTPTRTITGPGDYRVEVANACGAATAATDVTFVNCEALYIPNAFSPNGDGINDRLQVFGNSAIHIRAFRIFDRWGNLLYEALDAAPESEAAAWDGAARGRPLPMGAYLYVVDTVLPTGETRRQSGSVQLLR